MIELVLFVAIVLAIYTYRRFFTNLPPGPICWYPFVGYLPFLTEDPPRHLDKLRQKFGDVFGCVFEFELDFDSFCRKFSATKYI